MNLKLKPIYRYLLIIILLISSFLLGLNFNQIKTNFSNFFQKERACSEEIKFCPDGSAAGRTGPNCEFAPCPSSAVLPTGTERFTGYITDITYDCHWDGICRVIVDGEKKVVVQKGESFEPEEQGMLIDFYLDEAYKKDFLGKKVEVFAKKIGEGDYTLYGSTQYYLHVLEGVPVLTPQ